MFVCQMLKTLVTTALTMHTKVFLPLSTDISPSVVMESCWSFSPSHVHKAWSFQGGRCKWKIGSWKRQLPWCLSHKMRTLVVSLHCWILKINCLESCDLNFNGLNKHSSGVEPLKSEMDVKTVAKRAVWMQFWTIELASLPKSGLTKTVEFDNVTYFSDWMSFDSSQELHVTSRDHFLGFVNLLMFSLNGSIALLDWAICVTLDIFAFQWRQPRSHSWSWQKLKGSFLCDWELFFFKDMDEFENKSLDHSFTLFGLSSFCLQRKLDSHKTWLAVWLHSSADANVWSVVLCCECRFSYFRDTI